MKTKNKEQAILSALHNTVKQYGWSVQDSKLINSKGVTVHDIAIKKGRIRLTSQLTKNEDTLLGSLPASKPQNIGKYIESVFYAKILNN